MAPSITDRGVSYKVALAVEALFCHDEPGAVARLSKWYDVSRQWVYRVRNAAGEALVELFLPSDRKVRAPHSVTVDRVRVQRAVLTAIMDAAASERGAQAIVSDTLGVSISTGEVHAIVREAQERARRFNERVPLDCVEHVALDEVFSGGKPVFGGVDLNTSFVFLLERRPGRSGEQWAASLEQPKRRGLAPTVVAKDAGTGLEAGVTTALPQAAQQADIFHALKVMGAAGFYLERRAYKAIAAEYEIADKPPRSPRKGAAASRGQRLRRARERAEAVVALYDEFDSLRLQATRILQLVDTSKGVLRSSAASAAALRRIGAKMVALGQKHAVVAGKYISRQADKLASYQDRVASVLCEAGARLGGAEATRLAAWLWQLEQDYRSARRSGERRELFERAVYVLAQLDALVGEARAQTVRSVYQLIDRRARASSLIETINGLLRRHEKAHKGVSDGFLQLFQAWHNLRTYGGGKRKGKSPYELLTGVHVSDWLAALGYPPQGPHTSARKLMARGAPRTAPASVAVPPADDVADPSRMAE